MLNYSVAELRLTNFAAPIPYYIVFIILHIRWSFEKTCISHLSCAYIIMCKNIKNMAIKQIYLDYFIKRT